MMKKILIGLVLCAGMAHGQTLISTQIDSVKYQTRWLGDTVRFNVYVRNEKPSDMLNVKISSPGCELLYPLTKFIFKDLKVKGVSPFPTIPYTVYECAIILSSAPISVDCQYPRLFTWLGTGSGFNAEEDVIHMQKPTGIEDSFLNNAESKLVAMYDLQGRAIEVPEVGELLIAVYSDGRRRKIVMR